MRKLWAFRKFHYLTSQPYIIEIIIRTIAEAMTLTNVTLQNLVTTRLWEKWTSVILRMFLKVFKTM